MENIYRKPKPIQMQSWKPWSNGYIYNKTPKPKVQWSLQMKGWKDCKRIRRVSVRLCHQAMSEATSIKTHQHNYLNKNWTRTTAVDMVKWTRENPRPQPYMKNSRQLRNADLLTGGKTAFTREENTNWLIIKLLIWDTSFLYVGTQCFPLRTAFNVLHRF